MNGRWNCFCMSTDCRFVRRFCLNCSVASAVNIVTDPKRVETCLSSGTTVLLGSRIEEGSELLIASRGCSNRSLTLDVVRPLPSRATRGTSHGLPCGLDVTSFCFCTWRFTERDNYSSFDDLDGDRDALPRSPLCFTMAASFRLQTRRERVSFWIITCTISEPAFCYHDRHCLSLSCLQANLTSSAMCSP